MNDPIDSRTTSSQADAADNPLNEFAGCHEGIIENFKQLQRLLALLEESPDSSEIRPLAKALRKFYRDLVLVHHAEEEQELFIAVMDAATDKEEASLARGYIKQLVAEHRELEAMWQQIEPAIKRLSKGKSAELDAMIAGKLAEQYLAHAEFEEQYFMPLAARILSANDLSALGLSLHMRHQEAATTYYI